MMYDNHASCLESLTPNDPITFPSIHSYLCSIYLKIRPVTLISVFKIYADRDSRAVETSSGWYSMTNRLPLQVQTFDVAQLHGVSWLNWGAFSFQVTYEKSNTSFLSTKPRVIPVFLSFQDRRIIQNILVLLLECCFTAQIINCECLRVALVILQLHHILTITAIHPSIQWCF